MSSNSTDSFLRRQFGKLSKSLALSPQDLLEFAGELYSAELIGDIQLNDVRSRSQTDGGLNAAQSLLTYCQLSIDTNERNEKKLFNIMKTSDLLRHYIPSHSGKTMITIIT